MYLSKKDIKMRKKVLSIFLFVTVAQICLYACCGDEFRVQMTALEFTALDAADEDTTSIAGEDFSLLLTPLYQVEMASVLSSKSGFTPTATATSCDDFYTHTNMAENIVLTANVPLFGVPAGESLNDFAVAEFQYEPEITYTLTELLLLFNQYSAAYDYYITFNETIPQGTTANFTITIIFENEEQLQHTTQTITFE